jgi:xanthine dehydrogenase small subunit
MTGRIRFLLGHEPREVEISDPTMTVLNWLRLEAGRTGSKEGCAEGDCGACTVALGEVEGDRLVYRAVNSCIQFLPSLNGKQLLTVEDMAAAGDKLHPVQQAMVETHASQCGFCTPGFVMSLFALFHEPGRPHRRRIDDALAGNLCRCTGYGPIVAAAERMKEIAPSDQFAGRAPETRAALAALQAGQASVIEAADGRRWFAPRDIEALAALYLAHPQATLLAGGTDVGLWVTKQQRRLEPVIHLAEVAELKRLEIRQDEIEIGAAVTYERLLPVVAAEHPDFGEVLRRLGSTQIRACGTMGGNIANGSPIGDSAPPLIALGARLRLRWGSEVRELPLEDFFLDYGRQDRRPGELVESIRLPRRDPHRRFACYKISKRFDQDISACLGAFNLRLEREKVADIRIAFGGMAGVPQRALECERFLLGQPWSEAAIRKARAALDRDFTPLTDMRASKTYRSLVAGNLLLKFFHETTGPGAGMRVLRPEGKAEERAHG